MRKKIYKNQKCLQVAALLSIDGRFPVLGNQFSPTQDALHRGVAGAGAVRPDIFCITILACVEDQAVAEQEAGVPEWDTGRPVVGVDLAESSVIQALRGGDSIEKKSVIKITQVLA